MYLAFIPACQALFSVGWLHRKLKYNQKIVCWTWRVTLSICMLSVSSHITWCVPPSDMVSDMPGKLDVWARGSEPLLPGLVLEVSCHIWINSFDKNLSSPNVSQMCLWFTGPTRFFGGKKDSDKFNTAYHILICGFVTLIKSSEQTCLSLFTPTFSKLTWPRTHSL